MTEGKKCDIDIRKNNKNIVKNTIIENYYKLFVYIIKNQKINYILAILVL